MHRMNFLEHGIQDLRFSVRQLLKHPAFAVTAIVMLALGLAANVAIFGFVDAALIEPLPYRDPSRLVTAFGTRPESAQTQRQGGVSYLNLVDWRDRVEPGAFEGMAAYDVRGGFTLTTAAGPERVPGLRVTSGFFRTLGVTPILGREFRRDEEGWSAPPTVILSHGAWQTRFGARPDVLGQTVTLQGQPHVVIGVLPPDLHFPMSAHADFWATIRGPQACWEVRSCQSLVAIARLAGGASAQSARANLDAIMQQLRREHGVRGPETAVLTPLREVMLGDVRPVMLMLLSGAGLLLLIAGINVISLLLARSDSRTREIALRGALGASSTRLVLQFATEALVLVTAGGAAGLLLATWGLRLLGSLLSADMISRMPYLANVGMSARLVAFAGAICLAAAAAFTLAPIARTSASRRSAGLKEGSRGSAGTTWRRFGAYLVIAELAVAVVLLAGAGLLGKSLYRLLHVDAGFDLEGVTTVSVSPLPRPSAAAQKPVARERAGEQASESARGPATAECARATGGRSRRGAARRAGRRLRRSPAPRQFRPFILVLGDGPRRAGTAAEQLAGAAHRRDLPVGARRAAGARPLLHGGGGRIEAPGDHHQRERRAPLLPGRGADRPLDRLRRSTVPRFVLPHGDRRRRRRHQGSCAGDAGARRRLPPVR